MNCSFLKRNLSKVATIARYFNRTDRIRFNPPPRFLEKLINFPITSAPFHPKTFSPPPPLTWGRRGRRETFSKITRPSPIVRQRDVRFLSLPRVSSVWKRKECRKFRGGTFRKRVVSPLAKRRRAIGWLASRKSGDFLTSRTRRKGRKF